MLFEIRLGNPASQWTHSLSGRGSLMVAVKLAVRRFLHGCRLRIAIWLAAIELHRVGQRQIGDQTFIAKRRTLLAKLLIPPGNLFLRISGSRVTVLSVKEWRRWEQVMRNAITDDATDTDLSKSFDTNCIVTKQHPGRTLHAILLDKDSTADQKRNAIWLALDQLLLLQSKQGAWREIERDGNSIASDEVLQSLSHGDATVENVCVDLENESAAWFDFDMRHRTGLSANDRQADDLRAFLFSAAAVLPQESIPQMVEQCLEQCLDKIESSEMLSSLLAQQHANKRPTIFELAQAPLNYFEYQLTRSTLINSLKRMLNSS